MARRVLVVDDDPDIRALVRLKFAQAGFEVLTEQDGPAGLATARRDRPDLVVLDVMMPGLTGIEVCRELRADGATAALPVVLMSANAQAVAVADGLAAGADEYIVKPFSLRDLMSRVEAVLARAN